MADDRMLSDEILLGIINSKSGGGGGTTDYDDLTNQPQINGNTLVGNKTASDLGLASEDDLDGKQGVLTAGKYININANNEISVDPVVPNEAFTYLIEEPADYTLHVTKRVDDVVTFEETYIPTTWDVPIDVTLDNAIRIYTSLTGTMFYELVIASDTHDAGFKQNIQWFGRGSWTETFSTVDHSGEKLITKSELDTALATKADLTDLAPAFSTSTAYTVGQYVSYDGNIYKCTSAHSAGAWVAGDFTLVAVGSELESKQNATDNSLQTTDKTVVGAVNELKSGLTNYERDNNWRIEAPERKNHYDASADRLMYDASHAWWLDSSVNKIASGGNTNYTWAVKCYPNTTYTVSLTHTSTTFRVAYGKMANLTWVTTDDTPKDIYGLQSNSETGDVSITITTGSDATYLFIQIGSSDVDTAKLTMQVEIGDTATTFAPYIPSVESRIEAVESGLTDLVKEYSGGSSTSDSKGVLTTDIPSSHHILNCNFANYMLLPFISIQTNKWSFMVTDIDGSGNIKSQPNKTATFYVYYI